MRKLITVIVVVAVAVVSHRFNFASASPAATQNWVKQYVGTNMTASASYTNSVMMSQRLASNMNHTMMQILYEGGSNAVERALSAGRVEAAKIAEITIAGSNNL